jgi:hypothetical protein
MSKIQISIGSVGRIKNAKIRIPIGRDFSSIFKRVQNQAAIMQNAGAQMKEDLVTLTKAATPQAMTSEEVDNLLASLDEVEKYLKLARSKVKQ